MSWLVRRLHSYVNSRSNTGRRSTVINKRIILATLAALSTAALAGAQAPQGGAQPQTPRNPDPQAATPAAQQMTLTGCLYREDQVPGRRPNVAERAGVLEDYILADATVASAEKRPGATAGATGTTGTAPASGNMYKVEGPPDERLKPLVGKRVEVMGRIDPEGAPGAKPGAAKPDRGPGPDEINLPEFEASSIREISGTCPATPAPRK
jgi:hypothetical protein